MGQTVFTNVQVFDATGRPPFPGEVLLQGNQIRAVAEGIGRQLGRDGGAQVIDGQGMTLMPGLVEGHGHLSFGNAARNTDLGDLPPEEHLLLTMHNAKTLLDCGFTSVYGAASAKLRLDLVIRNEVNAGRIPGPRIRAAGPEITVTGGLADERHPHQHRESFGIVIDGPIEMRAACRLCAREGVDTFKLNISGDEFVSHARAEATVMMDDEVFAAVEVARATGKRVSAHARAAESVKRAVRNGVDVIYHCDFADEEALDLLESQKDRIFVGPAIGLLHNTLYEAEAWGLTREWCERHGFYRKLERTQATYHEMRRRGIRVVIGGDYGFAWIPQGTNARDLGHFVRLFGYSPIEALMAATKVGGEIMGLPVGQVREGYLADLLLVRGDPTKDVDLLVGPKNLALIMKDGQVHRSELGREGERVAAE